MCERNALTPKMRFQSYLCHVINIRAHVFLVLLNSLQKGDKLLEKARI